MSNHRYLKLKKKAYKYPFGTCFNISEDILSNANRHKVFKMLINCFKNRALHAEEQSKYVIVMNFIGGTIMVVKLANCIDKFINIFTDCEFVEVS